MINPTQCPRCGHDLAELNRELDARKKIVSGLSVVIAEKDAEIARLRKEAKEDGR